jgi:hypothetical protein
LAELKVLFQAEYASPALTSTIGYFQSASVMQTHPAAAPNFDLSALISPADSPAAISVEDGVAGTRPA